MQTDKGPAKKLTGKCMCGASVFALLVASCDGISSYNFETSVDPGGCVLEHVLVEPGMEYYQFDSLSPDGRELITGWRREEERGTVIYNLETGERTDLAELNNGGGFSPDGRMVISALRLEKAGEQDTDIVEYDRDTGETRFVAPHDAWDWLPSYSSDGETIMFNSARTGGYDIYTLDRESGDLKRWTDFDGYEAHAQFSPDDSKILFHRNQREGDYGVFVIDAATGEITKLTNEPGEDSYGSWSPDGSVIVFASDRYREPSVNDLFLMDADGGNVRRLTDYPGNDSYPFFSPDGKHIYFNSEREHQGVYRISLDENYACEKG